MAEPIRDPKQMQAAIDEYQGIQRQMQLVMMQRQQMEVQLEEMKNAQEELKTSSGGIYQLIGNLMIETNKEAAKKDLAEKIETVTVRTASLAKQEDKTRARLLDLRRELEKASGKGE